MDRLTKFRQGGVPWLYALLVFNIGATVTGGLLTGGPVVLLAAIAAAFAVVGGITLQRMTVSGTARVIFALIACTHFAIIVAAFTGHPWQIDMHMHFFATMGILILLADFRAILAGAALVAAHHIILNIALPTLVFPDGSDFGRLLIHAIVLVFTAAVLATASRALVTMSSAAQEQSRANENMIDQLNTSLGNVVRAGVQGDFTARVTTRFEDSRLQNIADGTNDLIGSVEQGISQTCNAMEQIAKGALNTRITGDFQGAFADLQHSVNTTVDTLRTVLVEVTQANQEISHETDGISQGAEGLSDQATQQAASVEETSAAMQALSESVKSNVISAQQMSQVATTTSQQVQSSQKAAHDATDAMRRMSESSDKIGAIVTMIDEIAFQTNLLALNASVEAARAGDAGQGFAVVAQEVRALAMRSGDSARDIRELIAESAHNVEEGVTLVDLLGTTLAAMVTSVTDVADMAQQIAGTSTDQSHSITEMSATVMAIDRTTQHTAGTAEDYFQKSCRLQEQVSRLSAAMTHFQSDTDQDAPDMTAQDQAAA